MDTEEKRIWFSAQLVGPTILFDGWKVYRHIPLQKTFLWKPEHTRFHLSSRQGKYSAISGHELFDEIKDKNVCNVNVLHDLYCSQDLIPEEWKFDQKCPRHIFFWGTIYEYEKRLFVLYLYWTGAYWAWSIAWLDGIWMSNDPALVQTKIVIWSPS